MKGVLLYYYEIISVGFDVSPGLATALINNGDDIMC